MHKSLLSMNKTLFLTKVHFLLCTNIILLYLCSPNKAQSEQVGLTKRNTK